MTFSQIYKKPPIFLLLVIILVRLYLVGVQFLSTKLIPLKVGFIGPTPFANFDGVHHYLVISKFGYQQFEQAFFPLYPLMIRYLGNSFSIEHHIAAFIISYLALWGALIFFWKLLRLDYKSDTSFWTILFLLAFPASFFFFSAYTESLFLLFTFGSFYYIRKAFERKKTKNKIDNKDVFISAVLGAFASATRLIGIFLIPSFLIEYYIFVKKEKISLFAKTKKTLLCLLIFPIGMIAYMIHLYISYRDPLSFIHSQPAFGAGRSGGKIILLPQVLWRYLKIFATIQPNSHDFLVAFLEFVTFFFVMFLLVVAYKKKVRLSYIVFSLFAILLPTLSGTLSSIPRYSLAAFAIFIACSLIKNTYIKIAVLIIFVLLQTILCMFFLRGYFVS